MSGWKMWLLRIALKVGAWEVKSKWPWLAPLIDEIIRVLQGDPPSDVLLHAATKYNQGRVKD